ncbi:imidazoleglycerol-phosphate dehydratase HisB [Acutalibacter sp. 1XD8-36]|uniref:imidazoleglycerol-phosphate dehydratase HisB n=1 Tax=Acutalibacter sp. 1XD8-36 TaxID=2320852 RepID=UPI001412AD1F|nr:imidazoleglycerol-phosphate dehydratase HisB [Acutalibacter sp. 1XD8-36]NBJ88210.1 imidazoleglycerol-phosphate dehydratase HisB [Acutalibacter sp. 1XD8-36]
MRAAEIHRKTNETDIELSLSLDGGARNISTGIGFFDHMLTALSVHGGLGLELRVKGDLEVDCHHTVEDTGIVLGQALANALGDRSGIRRYGHAFIPMDEALGFCALDISGRPFLVFEGDFPQAVAGAFDCCMTEEFFRAVSVNSGLTLHLRCEYGKNSHHMIEALFKAFAHALKGAVEVTGGGVLSSKGVL